MWMVARKQLFKRHDNCTWSHQQHQSSSSRWDFLTVGMNFQKYIRKIEDKSSGPTGPHGCTLWQGYICVKAGKYQYGKVRNPFPGGPRRMYVHKLVYYLHVGENPADQAARTDTGSPCEISHLCHQSLCTNFQHLCRESHHVNQERIHCKNQGLCSKCHSPHCLLWQLGKRYT